MELSSTKEQLSRLIRDRDLTISPMERSNLDLFHYLVREYVSWLYPETEESYAYKIGSTPLKGLNTWGSLTYRKQVWSTIIGDKVVGFFVASEKVGGNVKLGPIVIEPEYRRRDIGKNVIELLSKFYSLKGYGKMYMTIPMPNLVASEFAASAGFLPELSLKRQYSPDYDEVVFSKLIGLGRVEFGINGSNPGLTFTRGNNLFLGMHKKHYTNLSINLLDRLLVSVNVNFSHDSSMKARKIFEINNGDGPEAFIVSSPKRGGSVKLGPIGGGSLLLADLIEEVEKFYLGLGRSRRIYAMVDTSERNTIAHFLRKGYDIEGRIAQPFVAGTETVIVGKKGR